jgi:hypothetical protein
MRLVYLPTARRFKGFVPGLSLFLAVATPGCGPGGPAVEFVEGVVTLDDAPVADATVFFTPEDPYESSVGLPAAGVTKADGTFHLNATGGARSGGGTATGTYRVTVIKLERTSPSRPDTAGNELTPTAEDDIRSLIPVVYGSTETTSLRATVVPGKNMFRFSLVSGESPAKSR